MGYFQVSSFATWIECTKTNAAKGLNHRRVEQNCDDFSFDGYPPNCNHVNLFKRKKVDGKMVIQKPKGCMGKPPTAAQIENMRRKEFLNFSCI